MHAQRPDPGTVGLSFQSTENESSAGRTRITSWGIGVGVGAIGPVRIVNDGRAGSTVTGCDTDRNN